MRSRRLLRKSTPVLPTIITFNHEQYGETLLEQCLPFRRSFQSTILQKYINSLTEIAKQASATVICGPQINLLKHIFVVHKDAMEGKSSSWVHSSANNHYDYFANCTLISGRSVVESEEQNFSFPFFKLTLQRYNQITVTRQLLSQQLETLEAKGFAAFALQQGIDQMQGISPLDWRRHFGKITLKEEVHEYFPKTLSILEDYSRKLISLFKEYSQLNNIRSQFCEGDKMIKQAQEEIISIEEDFTIRITKYYDKEFLLLLQRIDLGLIQDKDKK